MGVFAVFSKAMLLRVPMIVIANLFCLLASTVVVITIDSALTIRRLCDSIWRSGQFGMFNRNYTLPTGIFNLSIGYGGPLRTPHFWPLTPW